MKILKSIVSLLANVAYVLIGIYVVIELPMIIGYKPLIVLSGSMEPTYKVGSILYYKEVAEEDIAIDDVITFSLENDTFVTHRVVAIEDGKYITQGDANNTVDAWKVEYSNVQGKVANLSLPYIGHYVYFVNNHLYLIVIVVLILLSEFLLSNVGVFDINRKKGVGK